MLIVVCVCILSAVDCQMPSSRSLLSHGVIDAATVNVVDVNSYHSPGPAAASQSKKTLSQQPIDGVTDAAESLKKCTIRVTGMTCGSCVANIEKHLSAFRGECLAHSYGLILIL